MKLLFISCLLLVIATALTLALPPQRTRTAYNYAPPQTELALPESKVTVAKASNLSVSASANTNAETNTASIGPQGYTYRSVRRLKYRQRKRRDVAHLPLNYLPPNNNYLLPNIDDTTEILNAAMPYVNVEYLPPAVKDVNNEEAAVENELQTEVSAVQVEQQEHHSLGEEGESPQDSAVLMDDGYHYKKPAEPMLLPKTIENSYLPPSLMAGFTYF